MLFARVCKLRDAAVLDGSRSLAAEAATNLAELLAHLAVIDGLAHKSLAASREWLAARFPQDALPTEMEFVHRDGSRTPAGMGTTSSAIDADATGQVALARPALSDWNESANSKEPLPRGPTIPLSAELVAYQFTVDRATHELLLHVQDLLGAEVAPTDLAKVFALALKSLAKEREKTRHGLHTESRGTSAAPARGRYIPAQLKAQVYQRDQGQCAFMTDDGLR